MLESFRAVLMGDGPVRYRTAPDHTMGGIDWVRTAHVDHPPRERKYPGWETWLGAPGRVTAPMVGGEAHLLVDMLEQGLISSLDGKILFWDVGFDHEGYAEEQFEQIGDLVDLSRLAGMVVGDNPNPWTPAEKWTATVTRILERYVGEVPYPVYVGGDTGHYDPPWTVPYGDLVTLDSGAGLFYRAEDGR
jgi:muramoyltetrapeptide carboxypeptidase LdcA involved in peptidoglycan recycling